MPIDLGLSRVARLLGYINNPHASSYKSIHIAGTNGKGSTIAYLSSIFTKSNIRNGRFTSPHMMYYNDCIAINNETYPLTKFKKVNDEILEKNRIHQVGCTEFELLTVTAFKIFEIERVELALIEVGVGGRLDATNVLQPGTISRGFRASGDIIGESDRQTLELETESEANQRSGGVIVTGITKIGYDHEGLLGNTLTAIATEKAGIIKPQIPCVVDCSNEQIVLDTIMSQAESMNAPVYLVGSETKAKSLVELSPLRGEYQINNLAIALKIIDIIKENSNFHSRITPETIELGISSTVWPGRLQNITLANGLQILLDGAHNEAAAIELGKYLQKYRDGKGIIFVIGVTTGKSITKLLRHIIEKDKDLVIATGFTKPEGMPWILSYPIADLQAKAGEFCQVDPIIIDNDIDQLFDHIKKYKLQGDDRKIVVCGSLYLCGDVLRLVT